MATPSHTGATFWSGQCPDYWPGYTGVFWVGTVSKPNRRAIWRHDQYRVHGYGCGNDWWKPKIAGGWRGCGNKGGHFRVFYREFSFRERPSCVDKS